MNDLDNIMQTAVDDMMSSTFDNIETLGPDPFQNQEFYNLHLVMDSGVHCKDSDKSIWGFTEEACDELLRLFSILKHAGLVEVYSDVYTSWTERDMFERGFNAAYKKRTTGDDMFFSCEEKSEYSVYEVIVGFRVRRPSAYLIKVFSHLKLSMMAYSMNFRTIKLYEPSGNSVTPVDVFYNSTERATFSTYEDEEDENDINKIKSYKVFDTVRSFHVAYIKLLKWFYKSNNVELSFNQCWQMVRVSGCTYNEKVLDVVQNRLGAKFQERQTSGSLVDMLSKMSIRDNGWCRNKKLFTPVITIKRKIEPYCFYSRENLSYSHLTSMGPLCLYDFAKHVRIDDDMKKNSMENVVAADVVSRDKGVFCVCLWHGLSYFPVSTISIGVVFDYKTIDYAVNALQTIYQGFDAKLFREEIQKMIFLKDS